MRVYLLMESFGHDETSVLGVFQSRGRTKALVSIGEREVAQRDLERHNEECLEIGRPHWQMINSLYSYHMLERELVR